MPSITLADRIGLVWVPPVFSGGAPILDYRLWFDDATGTDTFAMLAEGLHLDHTTFSVRQGETFTFKVQARNDYGYGDFSAPVSILAAQPPAVPSAPVTIWVQDMVLDWDTVIVRWVAPDNGGSPITRYTIELRTDDDVTFTTELTDCDGADTTIRDNTECTIPIATLKASPFSLPWGTNVHARITAWNFYGNYGPSEAGNGAIITTYPDPPTTLIEYYPDRDVVDRLGTLGMTWVDAAFNGGAVIIDYRVSIAVQGQAFSYLADGLLTPEYKALDLTPGVTYQFKV